MKITITTTTIHIPTLIEDYIKDIIKYGRQDYVDFVITGDKKSPIEAYEFCKNLQKKYAINIDYMGVEEQDKYMEKYPKFKNYLPWNCLQRRDVAILKAYDNGADIIILIDDDNFLACEDYVGKTLHLGNMKNFDTVETSNGWYNICEHLEDANGRLFYPRGYAWDKRIKDGSYLWKNENIRSVVNAGFWLGDPDIDAVQRLASPIDVISYNREQNFALGREIFCPFNSQNTAIHRDVVPAYFLCPDIGRFDDIWASYFLEKICWHLKDYITFGQPLVKQIRNEHDLYVDVRAEEFGTKYTSDFCNWIKEIKLTQKTYRDCAIELATKLKEVIDTKSFMELPATKRAFFNQFIDGMKIWTSIF